MTNSSAVLKPKSPADMFGKVINEGDSYFVVNGKSIHVESIEDYFIEILGASVHERKKPLTVRAVNGDNKSHQ